MIKYPKYGEIIYVKYNFLVGDDICHRCEIIGCDEANFTYQLGLLDNKNKIYKIYDIKSNELVKNLITQSEYREIKLNKLLC